MTLVPDPTAAWAQSPRRTLAPEPHRRTEHCFHLAPAAAPRKRRPVAAAHSNLIFYPGVMAAHAAAARAAAAAAAAWHRIAGSTAGRPGSLGRNAKVVVAAAAADRRSRPHPALPG